MDFDQRRGYRRVTTQRGFTYSYYFAAPAPSTSSEPSKPFLFFAHGFPSSSYSWHKQIEFFQPLGYGFIVPDMLGYGGTDKPIDPDAYIGSGLAQDIVDIFNQEKISQVIGVAHDWGNRVLSRLINHHPECVSACAFIGSGYGPPNAQGTDPISQSKDLEKIVGYDIVAYMRFFVQPDAAKVIEEHIDSFLDLVYPVTPEVWMESMCVDGGARAWIEQDKRTSLAWYITPEDRDRQKQELMAGGLSAPLCWYKTLVQDANKKDDANVPPENYVVKQPLLYVACARDCIARPDLGDARHENCVNKDTLTRKVVDADHWVVESHPDSINAILLEWMGALKN
ncbi:alpha/beta-hydrolase [Mycena maculata]|uniref:Alpha/beta-hydrolase n=1 Tax=Mycena maculata TaxID=230809 RepID=A0AAD7HAB5_9AGAR|nr:alpha/beta-hydrolase [Mycena maculata]